MFVAWELLFKISVLIMFVTSGTITLIVLESLFNQFYRLHFAPTHSFSIRELFATSFSGLSSVRLEFTNVSFWNSLLLLSISFLPILWIPLHENYVFGDVVTEAALVNWEYSLFAVPCTSLVFSCLLFISTTFSFSERSWIELIKNIKKNYLFIYILFCFAIGGAILFRTGNLLVFVKEPWAVHELWVRIFGILLFCFSLSSVLGKENSDSCRLFGFFQRKATFVKIFLASSFAAFLFLNGYDSLTIFSIALSKFSSLLWLLQALSLWLKAFFISFLILFFSRLISSLGATAIERISIFSVVILCPTWILICLGLRLFSFV